MKLLGLALVTGLLIPALAEADMPANVRVTHLGPANSVRAALDPLQAGSMLTVQTDHSLGASTVCGVRKAWVSSSRSTDGGATWHTQLLPGGDHASPGTLAAYPCIVQPTLSVDRAGWAHAAGWAFNDIGWTIWLAASPDGGATWPLTSTIPVATALGVWFAIYQPGLASDPASGDTFVSWTLDPDDSASASEVMVSRCLVGIDCATAVPVTSLLETDAVCCSRIALGSDGVVHVVFADREQGFIKHARSADGGLTFTAPRTIARATLLTALPNSRFPVGTNPELAADPRPGQANLVVTWADAGNDASDVVAVASADGGLSWSEPVRVNGDAPGKANFNPGVAMGPDGRIDIAFSDRRLDPGDQLVATYVASSRDGGRTWSDTRVSEVLFDGDLSLDRRGRPNLGPARVASSLTEAVVAWTDTRDGVGQIYAAVVPR